MAKNPVGKTRATAKPATARTRKPRSPVRRGTAKVNPAQESLDFVNYPPHYTGTKIETIEVLEDCLNPDEFVGFCKGNVLKYVIREKRKGGTQDLEKAAWYLNRAVKNRKGQEHESK